MSSDHLPDQWPRHRRYHEWRLEQLQEEASSRQCPNCQGKRGFDALKLILIAEELNETYRNVINQMSSDFRLMRVRGTVRCQGCKYVTNVTQRVIEPIEQSMEMDGWDMPFPVRPNIRFGRQ